MSNPVANVWDAPPERQKPPLKGSLWPPHSRPPACAKCPIAKRSRGFVPGFGTFAAKKLRIGEQPGKQEIQEGKPFQGASGEWLNKAQGGDKDAFTTNVRKCLSDEGLSKAEREASISYCTAAYLQPELDAIRAAQVEAGIEKASCLLVGADATKVFLNRENITKLHGTFWNAAEVEAMADAQFGYEQSGAGD